MIYNETVCSFVDSLQTHVLIVHFKKRRSLTRTSLSFSLYILIPFFVSRLIAGHNYFILEND